MTDAQQPITAADVQELNNALGSLLREWEDVTDWIASHRKTLTAQQLTLGKLFTIDRDHARKMWGMWKEARPSFAALIGARTELRAMGETARANRVAPVERGMFDDFADFYLTSSARVEGYRNHFAIKPRTKPLAPRTVETGADAPRSTATVRVRIRSAPRDALVQLVTGGRAVGECVTDHRTGQGTITGIAPGRYEARVFRAGKKMTRSTVAVAGPSTELSIAGDAGANMTQQLEFQVGLVDGHAVAHCPQTGQTAYVPLRDVAINLAKRGHIPDAHVGDDLLNLLDGLHTAGDIEIGRGKVRKKIGKAIKKTVKKTVSVAKKVAKSKLGKGLLLGAAALTGGAAAGALLATSRGKKVAKAAKKGDAKAKKTQALGAKVANKKVSKKGAKKQAKKQGLNPNDVQATAQALETQQAADAGDPTAAAVIATSDAIDNATVTPLQGGASMTPNADLIPDEGAPETALPELEDGGSDDNSDLVPEYSEADLGDEGGAEELEDESGEFDQGDEGESDEE